MVVGTFADATESDIRLREAALDLIEELLAREVYLVGANIVFDMAVCAANRPHLLVPIFRAFEQGKIISTDIIEKLRKIAHGRNKFDYIHKRKPRYSLAEMVDEYLGEKLEGKKGTDVWRLRYKELDDVPLADWPVEAVDYAVNDAIYTARVFMAQQEAAGNDAVFTETLVDLRRQTMAAFGLYMMRVWGFRTDPLAVDMLDSELHEAVDSELEYLLEAGIYKEKLTKKRKTGLIERKLSKNMKVITEMVRVAFEEMDEPCPYTEGGKGEIKKPKPKTDGETLLETLNDDLIRLARTMGDKKLLDTYVPILRSGTKWPINPFYNVMVDSGRTSCSRPNIQNQPRKGGVRECFVPLPGYVFVGCDYHTAELRALAQYCLTTFGVSAMAEALAHTEAWPHGKDLHLVMAAALLGISYEEAEKNKKRKDVKEARQLSKVLNFGYPGGLGAKKFLDFALKSYDMKLDPDPVAAIQKAKDLKTGWVNTFPEMKLFFQNIGALTGAQGGKFTFQCLGSGRLRGDVGYTDGCNCVDYETDALTRRGWVSGKDLTADDVLLTLNPKTLKYEWQKTTEITHFPDYSGPVVKYQTRNFSAVTTPNHRWLAEERGGGRTYVTDSEEFSSRAGDVLVRTGKYMGADAYSADFIRLVGWVLTDGSYRKDTPGTMTVRIYQSNTANPQKVQAIREILSALGIPVYETKSRNLQVFNFSGPVAKQLRDLFPDRALTADFVQTLSAASAELLIDTLVSGDGHRTKHSAGETRHFGTSSPEQAASFQMLCVLAGLSCSVRSRYHEQNRPRVSVKHNIAVQASERPYFMCTALVRPRTQILKQHKSTAAGNGVWCPTVPNGFFVARRAGTTYVTGNTTFQSLTADGAKLAVWAVVKESWTGWKWDEEIPLGTTELGDSQLLGYRPSGFIHDEIVGESPLPLFRQHAVRLADVMKEAMRWFVTDVPVEADAHCMRRWWKNAEPTRNADGLLIPWAPTDPYAVLADKAPEHKLLDKWWDAEDTAALQAEFPTEDKEDTWATMFRAHQFDTLAKFRTGEETL